MEAVGNQVIVAIFFMIAPLALILAYYWNNIKEFYLSQIANPDVPVDEPRQRQEIRRERNDTTCSICLTDPKEYEVSSTCGHSFCGKCLFDIYSRRLGSKIKCPLCRNDMSVIFKCFHEALPSERGNELAELIRGYNRAFDDNRPLLRRILQFPYVLKRLVQYIFSMQFVGFFLRNIYFIRLIFVVMFYFLLPVDLLPESMVGIVGFIDDVLVFIILASYVTAIVAIQFYRMHH